VITVVIVDAGIVITDPDTVSVTTETSNPVVPARVTVVPPAVIVEPERVVAIVKVCVTVEAFKVVVVAEMSVVCEVVVVEVVVLIGVVLEAVVLEAVGGFETCVVVEAPRVDVDVKVSVALDSPMGVDVVEISGTVVGERLALGVVDVVTTSLVVLVVEPATAVVDGAVVSKSQVQTVIVSISVMVCSTICATASTAGLRGNRCSAFSEFNNRDLPVMANPLLPLNIDRAKPEPANSDNQVIENLIVDFL
jgi:hypothetical protein